MEPTRPEYKAIVAMASNRVIGRDGGLPWRLPEDLKWFKKLTLGHPIIMGRKTCESLPKALPGRRNLVLTRSGAALPEGFERASSIETLETELKPESPAFIIGGAQIYELFFPLLSELYLSYVFEPYEGDTFLPPFEESFELAEVMAAYPEFELRRYARRG